MNRVEQLLSRVNALADKYEEIYKKTGGYFNIFSVLNVERKEVETHSRLLYDFLNPSGSHCLGDKYLRLFVDNVLNLTFCEEDYRTAKVCRELSFNGGESRIDLLIETRNFCIPIEVKIDAEDQDRQIERYYDYAIKTGKIAKVYYLTLDGKEPSKMSLGRLYNDSNIEDKVVIISFKADIINWLNLCVREEETIKISVLREIILQYISLLKKLTYQSEEGFKMETVNLILSSKDSFKSALEIERNLSTAKAAKMKEVYKIIDTFVTKDLNLNKVYNDVEKDIDIYYSNKKSYPYPGLSYKLLDVNIKNNIGLYLDFETNWNLYMGLGIAKLKNNQLEYLNPNDYLDMLKTYVSKDYITIDGQWICWNYILDSKGQNYDFRTFSDNILELDEKENNVEVDYFCKQISEQYNKYIKVK